jgi:hypothetical protein
MYKHIHGFVVHKGKGFKRNSGSGLRCIAATHNRRKEPLAWQLYDDIPTYYIKLDVTSRQSRHSPACAFSPLLFQRMEADWQGCKVHEGVDYEKYKAWWGGAKHKGKKCPRRCPILRRHRDKSQNNQYPREIGYVCPESGKVLVDKVEARKQIYCRLYQEKVLESEEGQQVLAKLRALMQVFKDRGEGLTIVVKDIDGPRDDDGRESWCEYNARVHEEKLNDLRFSFGHGYCVAQVLQAMGREVFGCE